jgi:RNA-binding protein with serine-rich domain 1
MPSVLQQLIFIANINRGMAYIQYTEVADAEAAIAHMHEATLDGNIISVSIVIPRRKFSSPPPVGRRGSYFPSRDSPPYRGPPAGRRRSPPRGYGRGRGGGHMDTYRPHLGPRSRSPRRHRSLSKSRSRSPVPRRGGRRETLERGGARRRSLSYSSYSSENGRSRSRGPDDGGRR